MEYKKILLTVLPYLASIIAGLVFYLASYFKNDNLHALFINLAAAFFAIPLIYSIYQLTQNFSHKKLNKEIFDYAKMQIDRELLSIINQIYNMVYTNRELKLSPESIKEFLSLKKFGISDIISKNQYLGFQMFKKLSVNEKSFHEILRNPFILRKLKDEQIISIISIIKSIRYLEKIREIKDMYLKTNKKTTDYKIVMGKELNKDNIEFPDRYLLLRILDKNHFKVQSFADIPLYCIDLALYFLKVNEKYLELYSEAIYGLIKDINKWINLTDKEFLIDTRMFRLGQKIKS